MLFLEQRFNFFFFLGYHHLHFDFFFKHSTSITLLWAQSLYKHFYREIVMSIEQLIVLKYIFTDPYNTKRILSNDKNNFFVWTFQN